MAGKFTTRTGKNGEFYFNLVAANGQVILTSEGYKSEASRDNGIKSVKTNAGSASRFERRKSSNGRDYFVLKAGNGEVIGRSQMYKSTSGCANGIRSVERNASGARVAKD